MAHRRAFNIIPVFTSPFTASQIREVLDQEEPVVDDKVLWRTTIQPYSDLCDDVLFDMDYVTREGETRELRILEDTLSFYDCINFAGDKEEAVDTAARQLNLLYEKWRVRVGNAKKERAEDEKDWAFIDGKEL
ncbi:MAG: hypothetical protein LQ350_004334 [Teloschistes chrysophthalmus]|nr:MAG: hypothetical protein LQ350_004334 [Niorma chrysophthalma]